MPKTTKMPTPRERTQQVREQQLAVFIDEYRRVPSRVSVDPVEKALGQWVYGHCRSKKPRRRVVELVERAGGYGRARGGKDVTEVRLEQLRAFVDEHGRLPRNAKNDKAEQALHQWARQQATLCVHPDPRVIELIDTHGGYPKRTGTRHLDRTQDLIDFIDTHGRLPRQEHWGYEDTLYRWIYRSKRQGFLSEEALRLVTQYETCTTANERRAADLEQFRATTGREPTRSEDYVESSLHSWAAARPHLLRRDPYTLGRVEFHDRQRAHERALPVVSDLHEFLAVHGRLPRNVGGEEGRLLGRVYANTRSRYPHPGLRRMIAAHGGLSFATTAAAERTAA